MLDKVKSTVAAAPATQHKKSIYDPTQEGLIYPQMPSFDNFEAERLHRKQRLVAACRAFALENSITGLRGT